MVELSVDHFLSCLDDGATYSFINESQFHVGASRCELDETQGPDEFARKAKIAYREILDGSLCLSAVKRLGRNSHLSHQVAFNPAIADFSSGRVHMKNSDLESERLPP